MQNPDIARLFDEVADLLEIQGANPFRVRAYRNAARIVRDYPEPLAEVVRSGKHDLTEISGIGDDLAEKIKIGRASCRERVEISGGAGAVQDIEKPRGNGSNAHRKAS